MCLVAGHFVIYRDSFIPVETLEHAFFVAKQANALGFLEITDQFQLTAYLKKNKNINWGVDKENLLNRQFVYQNSNDNFWFPVTTLCDGIPTYDELVNLVTDLHRAKKCTQKEMNIRFC